MQLPNLLELVTMISVPGVQFLGQRAVRKSVQCLLTVY